MTKRNLIIIIAAAVIIGLIGWGIWYRNSRPQETVQENYDIGAVLFLTGNQAPLGEEVKNTLTIVQDEVNESGGINGKKIRLVIEDSKDTARDGIAAYNKLASGNLPVIISTGDVVTLSLTSLADRDKLVLMSTVAASPGIPQQSDWVFRSFITADQQGKTAADYAFNDLKLKKVAILRINNEFGLASYEAFKKHFEELGGTVAVTDTFEIDQKDFRNTLAKIDSNRPEAIFVTGFGFGYGAAIKQIQEMKIKSVILTDNTLSIPYFQELAGGAEGVYFTGTLFDLSATTGKTKKFVDTYKAKYNQPPSFVGAFAYDSLYLIAEAIKKNGYSNDAIKQGLLSIKDYDGVTGQLSFDSQGELKIPVQMKRIEQGQLKTVSKLYNW